jgi:hypothetical protein
MRLLTGNTRTELYHYRISGRMLTAKQGLLERVQAGSTSATRSMPTIPKKVQMNMNMLTI